MNGLAPLIIQGLGYGFLAGITIGPFLGYVINIVLTRGWKRSLPLISIPVVVDTPIIIIFLNVLNELPVYALDVMSVVGGAFVLWLGGTTYRDNRRMNAQRRNQTVPTDTSPVLTAQPSERPFIEIYLRGLVVNALNPAPYLFWSTVSGPIVLDGIREGGIGYGFAFLVAYYGIFLSLIFVLMLIIGRLGELNEQMDRYLLPLTIVLMFVLGLGLLGAGLIDLVSLLRT